MKHAATHRRRLARLLWPGLFAVLLGCCLVAPLAAAPAAKDAQTAGQKKVVGISSSPAVYAQKEGKTIGELDGVYSATPEAYALLGREGDWLRIRFEGKAAWVRAADVRLLDEVLDERPYRKPLLCPDGLPASFALGPDNKPLWLTVERTATLTGGSGVMRLQDEAGTVIWTSSPSAELIGCTPGRVAWPLTACDLDGDGRPEIILSTGSGDVVPPIGLRILRWTGKNMETLAEGYVWQSGGELSETWRLSASPFEKEGDDSPPPMYRYVSHVFPAHFDGSFEALVIQEDRSANKEKVVTSRGVGLFRLRPDAQAFLLLQWVIPLR